MEEEPYEIFKTQADILGNGTKSEIVVKAFELKYVIASDGVDICTVQYIFDKLEHWNQTQGDLDQTAIDNIGEAIENQFP